jgi:hypothetical protein
MKSMRILHPLRQPSSHTKREQTCLPPDARKATNTLHWPK